MAIVLDALTKGTASTFQHTCTGSELFLAVYVTYAPTSGQEVTSIRYGGQEMSLYQVRIEDQVALCVGYLTNPATGTNDVEISMTESTDLLAKAMSYTGVSQSAAVWRIRDGVGKMVIQIPVKTFSKIGAMTLGVNAVNNVNAGNSGLYGNQVLVWDDTDSGMRANGISVIGTQDIDAMPVPNQLTQASCWAVIVLGVNPA